ncbi:MAG TPA: hypothetical protein VFA74_08690 [Terriglobales bacterium]|nr:hypothetical protein [Terriglobales bacterium]
MAQIRSLKPNVTMDEAVKQFSGGGLLSRIHHTAFGPLCSVAEFYIPFRLFEVEVVNRGKSNLYTLGLDAVTGSLSPYAFELLPSNNDVSSVETRNCISSCLSETEASDMIIAKVRRILFSSGFFRIQNLRISAYPVPDEIHIPYWVGFRGKGSKAHIAMIDAVRRHMEGGKTRSLLQNWLLNS